MKTFLLIATIIAVVSCEDTEHIKAVKACEKEDKLSQETIDILWKWQIPEGLEKCHMECIFKAFNWVSGSTINYSTIDQDFKNIKYSDSNAEAFIKKECGTLSSDPCDRSNELYKCFLDKYQPLQKFKDAFDQIEDTI